MLTVRHFWPQSLPHNQDRAEVRILASMVVVFYLVNIMETTLYALTVHDSIMAKVAMMTHNPQGVAAWFLLCAAAIVPHFVSLVFFPHWLKCTAPRRLACFGASAAALMWFYLSYLTVPLDVGPVPYLYALRACANLGFAAVLAFSLNAQQIRPRFHDKKREAD